VLSPGGKSLCRRDRLTWSYIDTSNIRGVWDFMVVILTHKEISSAEQTLLIWK
jgi:hypothetical protein